MKVAGTPSAPPREVAQRSRKTRRIAIRLTSELADQLQRAEKAREIEREQYLLELSDRDMDALLDAIANPPPPNAAMLRAAARWRERGSPA
jgi:uncharacterized protein (DUF1778 family)